MAIILSEATCLMQNRLLSGVPGETLLEGEAPVNGMARLVQAGVAGKLDHGRRSTHENDCVISRWRKVVLHHVLTDEALAVRPTYHMKLIYFSLSPSGRLLMSG